MSKAVLKKEEKKLRKALSKEQKKVNRAHPTRIGISGSGAVTNAKIKELNNAMCYVRQLLNPEMSGDLCRLPEPTPYPSSVSKTSFQNNLITITDAGGTDNVGGIIIRPFMNDCFMGLSAYNSSLSTETWTANAHPNFASYTTNFSLWRCVGLSVRVKPTTPLLSRGGSLMMFRLTQTLDAPFTGAAPVASALASAEKVIIDLSKLGPQGVMIPWLPITLQSTVFQTNRNAGEGPIQPTGSSYRLDLNGTHYGADTMIGFFYDSPAANPQTLEFEITHVWETIPVQLATPLFERRSVAGATGDISTAFDVVDRNLPSRGNTSVFADIASSIGGFGSSVVSGVHRAMELASDVVDHPLFKGMSQTFSSGLFGALVDIGSSLLSEQAGVLTHLNHLLPKTRQLSLSLLHSEYSHSEFLVALKEELDLVLCPPNDCKSRAGLSRPDRF